MKKLKFLIITCICVMLFSITVQAAVPVNSVIIGDKAYDINYLMDESHFNEISSQLARGGDVFYKFTGMAKWINVFDDAKTYDDASLGNIINSVTYYDASGKTQSVSVSDTTSDELTVISIE